MKTAPSGDEPVAETNLGTVEVANVGSTEDDRQRDKEETLTSPPTDDRIGNETVSQNLTRAQISVVKTLVYITGCFTLCWMPMYLYYLLSTFEVGRIISALTVLVRFGFNALLYGTFKTPVFPRYFALSFKF